MESAFLVAGAALGSAILTNLISVVLYFLKERKSDKESRESRLEGKLCSLEKRIRELEKGFAVVDERTKDRETSVSVPIADILRGDVRYERRG